MIIVIVLLVRTFVVTPAIVDGESMNYTLEDGQLVLINKFIYNYKSINRYDIVVVNNKKYNDKIIKRVIGLPGEKIEYKDDILYINDEVYDNKYNFDSNTDFVTKLGENEYFVMGDNRKKSADSRVFGNFKREDIVGKVSVRLFPFNKFGKIEK